MDERNEYDWTMDECDWTMDEMNECDWSMDETNEAYAWFVYVSGIGGSRDDTDENVHGWCV